MSDKYPTHLAYISGCEIVRLELSPGISPDHLSTVDGLTVFHIYETVRNPPDFLEHNYYNEETQSLETRESKPNPAASWDNNRQAWKWDASHLLDMVRAVRDSKLSACDWTQVLDNQLTEQQRKEWQSYRQTLRDITKTCTAITGLDDVKWPTEPKGD